MYAFEYGSLNKVASYRTSTAPIDLVVTGNLIAIADIMKSVSIVEYKRGDAGEQDTLTEVARHFQIAWGTAVAHVDDDTFLEADAEGNLMVLHQNVNGVTADDRRRLEVTSEIRLGEMVNRIRRINVPTYGEATVMPRAFVATVSDVTSRIACLWLIEATTGRGLYLFICNYLPRETGSAHASAEQCLRICPESRRDAFQQI